MIEVEKLSKIYGSTTAIKNVSFAVQQGEILGFLGPNGAGKTTTMRILSGYLPATSGRAKIAGYEVHENSMAVRQLIGYLPEIPPLYPEMTVEGFLYFVTRIKRVAAGDRSRRVQLAIEKCGLLEKRKVLIRKLSKGFRQRVGIAQALVHDPQVIILDEPTVGLDPRQIIEVRNLIKSLAEEHTIILSTHILPEVSMTCNRVAIINRGELVATGSPEEMSAKLVGGWGYELELEGEIDALERGVHLLENLLWVTGLERGKIFENNAGKNRLKVTVKSREEIDYGGEITSNIVSSGLLLCEMRRTQASLEDVFLNLTAAEVAADVEADVADDFEGKKDKLAADVADDLGEIKKDELAADVEADVADDLGEIKEPDEKEKKQNKTNFFTKILPSFGLKKNEERDDEET